MEVEKEREGKQTFDRDEITKITHFMFDNDYIFSFFLAWRKVFEDNDYGKIDRIIWYDQEAVIITGQGRRARALRYADGLETWQLAASSTTNLHQDSSPRYCQVIKNRFDPGKICVNAESFLEK